MVAALSNKLKAHTQNVTRGQLTAKRSILTDINRAEIFVVRITWVGCCIVTAVTRLQTSELFMAPKETVPESSGLHVTEMLSQIEIRSCHLRGDRVANLEHAYIHVQIRTNGLSCFCSTCIQPRR